jgi:hypothetical protein
MKVTSKIRSKITAIVATAFLASIRLAAQNNGTAPEEQTLDITLNSGVACAFGVHISGQGKAKKITFPGDRITVTSPGLQVTVTNLANSRFVTLNITGASHVTTGPDGSSVWVFTGRNLNLDPVAGFVLAIGNFRAAFDAVGNPIQFLNGKGQLIDICALIE